MYVARKTKEIKKCLSCGTESRQFFCFEFKSVSKGLNLQGHKRLCVDFRKLNDITITRALLHSRS